MMNGLEHFKKHFLSFANQYVLIGGSACMLIMENVGLEFRATKDLDIVLYVEALTAEFIEAFWQFIKAGGYQNRQKSTGKEIFYRFNSPSTYDFPPMLELFSRIPDTVKLSPDSYLTPIPTDEAISSLSAILLDEDYYQFIHTGKLQLGGLSVLGAAHLIPLKARAWLDLNNRRNIGMKIDHKDIRKHKNDVLRLYQLLIPSQHVFLAQSVKQDMQAFLDHLRNDTSIDLKSLGLKNVKVEEIVKNLSSIYSVPSNQS
ncbi:hypothetical protein [Parachlamydia sp. AcF125]|uniref:hypothetical protein n=1 Tax=Parachlamydia sp. AcF125 TaxID=2795736 RepID=UPI001BCA6221|nr:hypothetical protein [Parachlamydia sp. AcF125]MBS4168145.1 hypothetical protein [Parachlamydia sp. AcF125]